MTKGMIYSGIVMLCLVMLCGCGNKKEAVVPELEQVKSICELSTIECIYNNVAKGEKTKGEGLAHIGEKDRKYWIEYQGYVKIGIDLSQVEMTMDGETIKISLPDAQIQAVGIVDGSLTEDSVISSADSIWNKNEITAEEQKNIIADAQKKMEEEVKANKGIMSKATKRAKILIENYIQQLGNSTGVTYRIEWEQ